MAPPPLLSTLTGAFRGVAQLCTHIAHLFRRNEAGIDPAALRHVATIKIEWGMDLDKVSTDWSIAGGEPQSTTLKGRCKRCWGGLVARLDDNHQITGIKCRVCGKLLEGEPARLEHARMGNEGAISTLNMDMRWLPRYTDDGTFVQKVMPACEPLPKEAIATRIKSRAAGGRQKQRLTRFDFPPGSPGFFMLQASVLMASVEDISNPDEWSIADFPDVQFRDDGTAICTLSTSGVSDDPQFSERRLVRKMGRTMTAAMISAFACELAMKAIALTAKDEAIKGHNLDALYADLPEQSRLRIAADFPHVERVLKDGRHSFGAWRYFETGIGQTAAQAMINTEQARNLGKAARVILDEAEMMGLEYSVNLSAKEHIRVVGQTQTHHQDLKINVKGCEGPPRDESIPRVLPV